MAGWPPVAEAPRQVAATTGHSRKRRDRAEASGTESDRRSAEKSRRSGWILEGEFHVGNHTDGQQVDLIKNFMGLAFLLS